MRCRKVLVPILFIILISGGLVAHAEEGELQYRVYVTTQDYSSLRRGPGIGFERLEILPPATTLPAIGRTTDATWIQVVYGETTGWIFWRLLIWSGNMIELPADGVNPAPFIRLKRQQITVGQEMVIYEQRGYGPGDRVQFPAEQATVEVTARLGYGESFYLQFWYVDRYYWIGNWSLKLADYRAFVRAPNAGYVYPFGRLYPDLVRAYSDSYSTFVTISSLWGGLASGQSVSCDSRPELSERPDITEDDLSIEPIFLPAFRVLEEAINQTNVAIELLNDACQQTGADRFLTTDIVNQALTTLADAGRSFDLLEDLLNPIGNRDPISGAS